MENKKTERKIPFLRLIYKNLLLEILIIILCALFMLGYSIVTDKTYYTVTQSVMFRTSIDAGANTNASQSSNASHGKLYMPMIRDSITNPTAIEEANKEYKRLYPNATDKIEAAKIKVSYKERSLIFNISYTDVEEQKAKEKLAVVFDIAGKQLETDIKGEVDLILTDGVEEDGSVRYYSIVTSDSTFENVIIGIVIGVIAAVGVVFVKYIMDKTVKDKDELEYLTGVGVLTFIGLETKDK